MTTDLDKWQKKRRAYVRRKALQERAIMHLGGRCRICGYDRCMAALDIHHLDPMEKEFTISTHMTSWARIEKELYKCVLLCANCHRETHDGLHPEYIVLDERCLDPEPWFDDETDQAC